MLIQTQAIQQPVCSATTATGFLCASNVEPAAIATPIYLL
jgi:hypothetical protein